MGISSKQDVVEKIASIEQSIKDNEQDIKTASNDNVTLMKILKYVNQYRENKKYADAYSKSVDPERYMQNRLAEITLFQEAKDVLKASGIEAEKIDVMKLMGVYQANEKRIDSLKDQVKKDKEELKKIDKIYKDFNSFMGQENTPVQTQPKQQSRSSPTPKRSGDVL